MPNFSAEDRRALSGEELDLATQSRQPQLGKLSDADLAQLISRLRAARDKARGRGNRQAREARGKADPAGVQPAGGNEGTVVKEKLLNAALRRATIERKRRQATAAQTAGKAVEAVAQAKTGDAPDAATPAAPKKTTARKPATRSNTAARGAAAKAATQTTDRRGSGARKVAKPKPVAAADAAAEVKPAAAAKPAPAPAPAPTPAPVEAEAAPSPTALVKDLTEKAARRATKAKKAQDKAEKAARRADKLGDKKSRKASQTAEEKARKAERKARKTVRLARKAAADLS